jgi:hypothetical protein
MSIKHVAAALAVTLAACAPTPTGESPKIGAVGVIGTPFLVAFKIPLCAATVALAGPVTAVAQIASAPTSDNFSSSYDHAVIGGLEQSIEDNCGPPYVVTP